MMMTTKTGIAKQPDGVTEIPSAAPIAWDAAGERPGCLGLLAGEQVGRGPPRDGFPFPKIATPGVGSSGLRFGTVSSPRTSQILLVLPDLAMLFRLRGDTRRTRQRSPEDIIRFK